MHSNLADDRLTTGRLMTGRVLAMRKSLGVGGNNAPPRRGSGRWSPGGTRAPRVAGFYHTCPARRFPDHRGAGDRPGVPPRPVGRPVTVGGGETRTPHPARDEPPV